MGIELGANSARGELQHCVELEDMVHMTRKVERQIKRRGSTRFETNSASSSSTWRPNLKREGAVQPKPYAMAKPPKAKKDTHTDGKGKSKSQPDVDQPRNTSKDLLHVPNGPMTRSKTKALNALVLNVSTKSELKGPLE
jgi:hypothetical protein